MGCPRCQSTLHTVHLTGRRQIPDDVDHVSSRPFSLYLCALGMPVCALSAAARHRANAAMLCARCAHGLPASRQHPWAGSGIVQQYAKEIKGRDYVPYQYPRYDKQRYAAMAMAGHHRLGQDSPMRGLDYYLLRRIGHLAHEDTLVPDAEREPSDEDGPSWEDGPNYVPASPQYAWAGSGIWQNNQHIAPEHQFRQQRQDRATALAMSQHGRLGEGSSLPRMKSELIEKILDLSIDDQEREYMSAIFPEAKKQWLDKEQITALWADDAFVRRLLSKFPLEILKADRFRQLPPDHVRASPEYWRIALKNTTHLDYFAVAALEAIPRHIRQSPPAAFKPIIKEIVRQIHPERRWHKSPRWLQSDRGYWAYLRTDPFFQEPFV